MSQNVSAVEQAFEKASASLAEQANTAPTENPAGGQAANTSSTNAPAPVTTTESATSTTVSPAPQKEPEKVPEGWVWNGDVNSLPDVLKEYGKGVQRVYHKGQSELADARKEIERLKALEQQVQAWQQQQQQLAQAQQQQPPQSQDWLTEQEWQEAQLDPRKFQSIIDRRVNEIVAQLERAYAPIIQEGQKERQIAHAERTINDFAEVHPDFWQLYDAGILKPIIREVVEVNGGTLDQAYERAKKVQGYFDEQSRMKSQARVAEKKGAVTLSPSQVTEPEVVFANDRDDAFMKAFDNAWNNKKVKAVIRPPQR